jgi:hypothetical protein
MLSFLKNADGRLQESLGLSFSFLRQGGGPIQAWICNSDPIS